MLKATVKTKRMTKNSLKRLLNRPSRSRRLINPYQNQEPFCVFVERFTGREFQIKTIQEPAND